MVGWCINFPLLLDLLKRPSMIVAGAANVAVVTKPVVRDGIGEWLPAF
jgi:hypothetical protein